MASFFVIIGMYFARMAGENYEKIKKTDFIIALSSTKERLMEIMKDELSKNHGVDDVAKVSDR